MKKTAVILFITFLVTVNLFSQKSNNSSISSVSGYINVDGGKLYYEMAGEGENIVLIHDGIVHNVIWDEQFLVYAKSYKVVRYDRRSYGKSSNPEAPYSNLDDLYQLFIQLKIDKAVIFGMSAGGALAIDFTLKYPEKVSGLVLSGAVVSGYGYSTHMMTRGNHVNLQTIFADPKKFLNYFMMEDPYSIYSENITVKEKLMKLLENNIFISRTNGIQTKPPERMALKFLSEIKVPALILVGEFDHPDVHAHSGVIETGIPNTKREIIYKAGHLIPMEQPEAFNASVLKFLKNQEFFNILNSKGVNAAVQYFMKKHENDTKIIMFEEDKINTLAYQYLHDGKQEDAIELFKLNTVAFPESFNTYDSLGEAYILTNQKELAIKNYKKSIELNPKNENGKKMLKTLER